MEIPSGLEGSGGKEETREAVEVVGEEEEFRLALL